MDARPYRRPTDVRRRTAIAVVAALALCLGPRGQTAAQEGERVGEFTLLTYNVAGLPEGISHSRPRENIPMISRLLNAYDLVLIQEDFAFQRPLRSHLRHRFISRPSGSGTVLSLGDGLSRFSLLPFHDLRRQAWTECHGRFTHGADCMAPKGFSVATHRLSPHLSVDVYNLHMDAGGSPGDRHARASQIVELAEAIEGHSNGRPIIVAGDTNVRENERSLLASLLAQVSLEDCCTALSCGDDTRVDRIFYRSAGNFDLSPQSWRIDPAFIDQGGAPLSDHAPVTVLFRWQSRTDY